MNALVGRAQDEDDDFWGGIGGEFFGKLEPSEDENFTSNSEN